ncbi:putative acyl-CoA synthetase YngI [Cyphellophora attinorum]|uniref:Putative acyl-CoA synthetase YngI n=1 Tax=Cyphellophora attinorum TaxID=1664694 RepID=A0A0N1NXC9_9EURO|nr:putative acyl-CoA synthetase YngI [Phialophora attinorum]KPI37994.1 putative acyl-CoA synthetase YngI [Phialophora attinorum]
MPPSTTRLSIIQGPTSPPLLEWTFNDLLDERCRRQPNHTALICPQQSTQLTYSELQTRSRRLAACLHGAGVGRGDRVGILLGNRAEYVEIFLACAKLGAYATLFNYAYTQSELENALESTDPKVLFTTLRTSRYEYQTILDTVRRKRPSLQRIVLLNDVSSTAAAPSDINGSYYVGYEEFLSSSMSSPTSLAEVEALEKTVKPHDILNLQFTSGSTGLPKAAALTHRGMLNSARFIGKQMGVSEIDRILVPVPLFHAFGLIMGLCNACVYGASVVLPSEYWSVPATLSAIEQYQCTGLYGVTTMFVDQLSHPSFATTKRSSLRFGMMAGSAMPEELLNRVMTSFPIPALYTNWGMTELSSVATMTTAADPVVKKMATAGRLLPHFSAKIVEPNTDRVLPWGARGEIVISGFGVMDGYFRNTEKTAEAIKVHHGDDGVKWMHTGDEGYLDSDGYFVITGRIKDLIIRGGENISPLEIEARLYQHPAVAQAVVFGFPSSRYGEEVAAMLEEAPSKVKTRPTDKQVKDWVGQALARFKVPVHVFWLGDEGTPTEWPKTSNGKLRKMNVKAIGEQLIQKKEKKRRRPPVGLRASL